MVVVMVVCSALNKFNNAYICSTYTTSERKRGQKEEGGSREIKRVVKWGRES